MNNQAISEYEGIYKTSGEYVAALQSWLHQIYHYQIINAGFPYFLAASLQSGATVGNTSLPVPTSQPPAQQPLPVRGQEYLIPPMWKRLAAETIDFLLLFTIKLAVTYVAVDYFNMFDIEYYNLENLKAEILSDYQFTMNMTWDILLLETIHRIGNCVFEAMCLHRGRSSIGGATPGKKLMGLKVVRCQWLAPTLNEHVLVFPADDLSLGRAFVRSITKNMAITLLLPLCMTMFLYQHNRTLYDVMAGSVVVEERRTNRTRNNMRQNVNINNNNNIANNNNNVNNANIM